MARLYSVAHYALGDATRPLRFAAVRLVVAGALGYVCALYVPSYLHVDPQWGAAGLTASAGVAGWIEFTLLRRSLNARIGPTGLPAGYVAELWTAAVVGATVAWGVRMMLPPLHPIVRGAAILPAFGAGYFGVAAAFGIPIPGLRRR